MTLRVLSLGAGVQSTTMALMAAHGEIEPPDFAVFADTGAEPAPVYEHLRWLMSGNVLPFPVHIVSRGNLRSNLLEGVNADGHRFVSIPFHGRAPAGKPMMARRQCTEEYKLKPIRRFIRDRLGVKRPRPGSCTMLVGISRDEVERMKPSRVKYITNTHPLIDLGLRRWDCLRWLERNGYPTPPKSACCECPFRKNEEWRWLRDNDPAGFAAACAVDAALRANGRAGRFEAALYLHRSLVPLAEADIRSDEDRGQLDWISECEGMCGV
ncbi:hypothetical protein [Azospirillum sp. ST 5-10]|uniref:hypothetical protein n=1 Tax=unclassified Azospirillum TaxID=2630922 RepID=UPI003F4A04E6